MRLIHSDGLVSELSQLPTGMVGQCGNVCLEVEGC